VRAPPCKESQSACADPSARFAGDGAFHTGGGDICRMAQKLWDFGRRNGGTGRKNSGILQAGSDLTRVSVCRQGGGRTLAEGGATGGAASQTRQITRHTLMSLLRGGGGSGSPRTRPWAARL